MSVKVRKADVDEVEKLSRKLKSMMGGGSVEDEFEPEPIYKKPPPSPPPPDDPQEDNRKYGRKPYLADGKGNPIIISKPIKSDEVEEPPLQKKSKYTTGREFRKPKTR